MAIKQAVGRRILLLLPLLAAAIWLAPRLPALYHQERGGRLLAQALQVEGRSAAEDPWLVPELLARPEARLLAERARAEFAAAVAADRANAQAYRWLGRASLLLGQPEEALTALSAAVRLRPENPLVWWELGLAYERLTPPSPVPLPNSETGAFALAGFPRPVIMDNSGSSPLFIPAADWGAPWLPVPDSLLPAEGVRLPSVGYASWLMPDAAEAWPAWWVPSIPLRRSVLLSVPPSKFAFSLSLPVTPTALLFWMGMDPVLREPQGDGVVYRVRVDGREVFSQALGPEEGIRGWWPARVDLSPWAGRRVRLELILDPGPAGDTAGDWAGWGDVQLVQAQAAPCVLASCRERAAAAWREGGFTAQDFIQMGETARRAKRYEEALAWYGRAARVEPEAGDPWYYAGLAYEGMERWEEALQAYRRAMAMGTFAGVHRSSPYYRMGVIYQWRLEPRQTEAALAAYEEAIAAGDFSTSGEAADCHYKRGEILWWTGGDPNEYIAEFQKAIALNPNHASAHILLGVAYYTRDKDVAIAEAEIRKAIELSPQNKWAYYYLGEIYRREGRTGEARAMYERALEIDPQFKAAQERLEALRNQE